MAIDISVSTQSILDDVADTKLKQRHIAQSYRLGLQSEPQPDWPRINKAIKERWSMSGLLRIKRLAWSGNCFPPSLRVRQFPPDAGKGE